MNKNSLLYWYPKVKDLDIRMPKTVWVKFPYSIGSELIDRTEEAFVKFNPYLTKIKKIIDKNFCYPVFIRTDLASGKHNWKNACFVRNESELLDRILNVLEFNFMAGILGLDFSAIVIREFLELDWRFKAFHGEMPVAKERRYFINNGEVVCHHPYWIEDAISQAHKGEGEGSFLGYLPHRLPNKWRETLATINFEDLDEVLLLSAYSLQIAQILKGYWSIDFAFSRDENWYLIDMALGEVSYHVECSKSQKMNVLLVK